ncbi:MAG: hypothetical protein ACK41P_03790 [Asticcacaulis sp.]
MSQSLNRNRLMLKVSMAAFAVTAFGLLSLPAQAQDAARVDAQLKPNFGGLINPPVKPKRSIRKPRSGHGDGEKPPVGISGDGFFGGTIGPKHPKYGKLEFLRVDCDVATGPHPVQDAINMLRPGGLLVLANATKSCRGDLTVTKPLIIRGERSLNMIPMLDIVTRAENRADEFAQRAKELAVSAPAHLKPQGARPCLRVRGDVEVNISDVIFDATEAGRSSCLDASGASLTLTRTEWRYSGDESALSVSDGYLDLRDSVVAAETLGAAIRADRTVLDLDRVTIGRAAVALDLMPDAAEHSEVVASQFFGRLSNTGFGPRPVGVVLRGSRNVGAVFLRDVQLEGYAEGLMVEGGHRLEMLGGRIRRAEKGLTLYNGQVRLEGTLIQASQVGANLMAGQVEMRAITIDGVSQGGVISQPGVVLTQSETVITGPFCEPLFQAQRGSWGSTTGRFINKGYAREWRCSAYNWMDGYQAYSSGGRFDPTILGYRTQGGKRYPVVVHDAYTGKDGFGPSNPYYDRNGAKRW